MASTVLKTTKEGKAFYLIRVHPTADKEVSRRWYVPEGWSKTAIKRELTKVAAEFERQVKAGEILNRAERAAVEAKRAAEEARISSFKSYVEKVYMPGVVARCSETTRTCYGLLFKNNIFPSSTS